MSQAENPNRLASERSGDVSVEDVRELMGASTPHFALQLRNRIATLIAELPDGHPGTPGRRARDRPPATPRLDGETRGEGGNEGERPLPSLSVG